MIEPKVGQYLPHLVLGVNRPKQLLGKKLRHQLAIRMPTLLGRPVLKP
jgi:hypothetical protein